MYDWFDYKQGKKPGEPSVTVSWQGRWYGAWGDEHSPLLFAARPQEAPVLHVGGPLQMGFESRLQHVWVKKGDDTYELNIGVGTPGVGKGSFVHLTYWDDAIPKDVYPEADFEFPNRERGGPPRPFPRRPQRALLKLPLPRHRACPGRGRQGPDESHPVLLRLEGGQGHARDV